MNFIFDILIVIVFQIPYSNTILITFSKTFATFFYELCNVKNLKCLIKDKKITKELVFTISLITTLIHIL